MMRGLGGIIYKEFIQISRNPATLVITLMIPIVQLVIFGYAIDTEVRNVRTLVLDLDNTPQSREFLNRFSATGLYDILGQVASDRELEAAIVSGRASVGIQIPAGYGRELSGRRPAQILVLIDGSNNTIASQTMSTAQTLGIRMSIEQVLGEGPGASQLVDVRPRFLFNPALRSANFFVPGLVGVILFLVTMLLTSFAIVREKELGTMEQLAVSPVSRGGLMLGKILPYLLLGMIQMNVVLFFAQYVFGVEIAGSLPLLEVLALVFVFSSLGLGLIISTIARTQLQAMLMSFMILLPSILLSGFIFPRESMPLPIYLISALLPVTYFVEILRGVILRSAGMEALWDEALVLCCMGLALLAIATVRFRKTVG
ncbi:ABC transporter permease [bacterium]|nr:ABC transporter permease [bacterium]